MNYLIKTYVLKCLNLLPNTLGYKVYYLLQNFSENKHIGYKVVSSESSFDTFLGICQALKITTANKSVIEIGSGWLPKLPYFLLYKATVKKVFTFDLNKHYQKKSNTIFILFFLKPILSK